MGHESELDLLLHAEAAFQRAAGSAKYLARKLSAANTLEHASTRRLAELADLLDTARVLYDPIAAEHEPSQVTDPALGDTQVAEVDAAFAGLAETLERRSRR